MIINKKIISESIELSAIKTDKFKSGLITFTLTLPLDQRSYLLSLLIAGVLRRGTEIFPKMADINRRLDELYASSVDIRSNMLGDGLLLIFTAEFLDDRYIYPPVDVLGGVIEVVSQMLLHPIHNKNSFPKKTVAQELKCVSDSLRSEINNTRVYAAIRCNELMNRDNPSYPTVEGLLKELEGVTSQDIYRYYKDVVLSSPLDVFYIGNADADVVADKVLVEFKDFKGSKTSHNATISNRISKDFATMTKPMPVTQGKLTMGFDVGCDILSDDYYAALVMNEIFGGFSSSKLFLNVREKMNICYYCSSSYSIYSGNLMVSGGIDNSNRAVATEAILAQLKEIQNGNISDDEIFSAKRSILNCYKQIYDNPYDIQAFYGGRILFGITESIEECQKKLSAVTRQEIIAVANKMKYVAEFFVEGTSTGASNSLEEDADEI